MPSSDCEKAINDALRCGVAILKFISANDVMRTGSHQYGFYLPKSAWRTYTPYAPRKGRLDKHHVLITWPDDRTTDSVITWYGQRTRSEYRLTRFGEDFPYLVPEAVGNLLVLIPVRQAEFVAYILDSEDDIEEILAALGVEPFERWGIYQRDGKLEETENECIDHQFRHFARSLNTFPSGDEFSSRTLRVLENCVRNFGNLEADSVLMQLYEAEYRLFRVAERLLCQGDIAGPFRNVDDFISTAATIMNRRKSRAGRSLENHLHTLLTRAGIPHEMRAKVDGRPDVVIPSCADYSDRSYPLERLFIIGVKTTCKDRWRQVLNEARRVPQKHIVTIQPGISSNQLEEMRKAGITLIVPRKLHRKYPRDRNITILNIKDFIRSVKQALRIQ